MRSFILRRVVRGRYATLGFGAAAWKIAPRDKFVGPETRRRDLPLAAARSLILP